MAPATTEMRLSLGPSRIHAASRNPAGDGSKRRPKRGQENRMQCRGCIPLVRLVGEKTVRRTEELPEQRMAFALRGRLS